jgi:hypothetical protein
MLHAHAVMPKMVRPMMAVLPFQFFGLEYQPPVGDQTCLGYLAMTDVRDWMEESKPTELLVRRPKETSQYWPESEFRERALPL